MLSRRDWIAAVAFTPLLSAQSSFLSPDQTRTLESLGECIIPGSGAAKCSQTIDLLLSVESPKNQSAFLDALASFKTFADLSASRQTDLLTAAATESHALYPSFELIKEWLADSYWSSKPGLQYLGWNGQMAWPTFKGCPHTSSDRP